MEAKFFVMVSFICFFIMVQLMLKAHGQNKNIETVIFISMIIHDLKKVDAAIHIDYSFQG